MTSQSNVASAFTIASRHRWAITYFWAWTNALKPEYLACKTNARLTDIKAVYVAVSDDFTGGGRSEVRTDH